MLEGQLCQCVVVSVLVSVANLRLTFVWVLLQAAFLLPIIHGIQQRAGSAEAPEYGGTVLPQCIIIAPTRELVSQIHMQAKKFSHNTGVRAQVVYGGTHVRTQLSRLQNGCEILVGTPGRLMMFLKNGEVCAVLFALK